MAVANASKARTYVEVGICVYILNVWNRSGATYLLLESMQFLTIAKDGEKWSMLRTTAPRRGGGAALV